jgi:hypothetical protein
MIRGGIVVGEEEENLHELLNSVVMPWAQTISRRPLTSESRIGRTIPRGIYVKQNGTASGLSPIMSVLPAVSLYHRVPNHSPIINAQLSYVKTGKTSSISNSIPHALPLSSPKLRTRSDVSSVFLLCTKLARTGTRDSAALDCERSEQLKQISRRITHASSVVTGCNKKPAVGRMGGGSETFWIS